MLTTTPTMTMMMDPTKDMDDPFADLPIGTSTDETTIEMIQPIQPLVSPLEYGTGIKYMLESNNNSNNNSTSIEKPTATVDENDHTEVTAETNDESESSTKEEEEEEEEELVTEVQKNEE